MEEEKELITEETEMKESPKKKSGNLFYIIIAVLSVLIFGVRIWWVNSFGVVQVDGNSMLQTLEDGEQLLMQFVHDGKGLKRGDVIVVNTSGYAEVKDQIGNQINFLIKRLIAIEGDAVRCERGQIYIKYSGEEVWTELDEEALGYTPCYQNKDKYNFPVYEVGKGEIFFLGDNRDNSCDSRYKETQYQGSHLRNSLYKATDVYGVVPQWAIAYKDTLEKIFF